MAKQLDIREIELSKLNPAPYNPRQMTEEALARLDKSITKFGIVEPIIWNEKTGHIVGGHQRFKILQKKGIKKTEVVVVKLSPKDEKALNVMLNNPSAQGTFDLPILKDLLESLDDGEFDLGLTGFDGNEIEQMMTAIHQEPEEIEIKPYNKIHVLISMEINQYPDVQELLQKIKEIPGIEYEQSAN